MANSLHRLPDPNAYDTPYGQAAVAALGGPVPQGFEVPTGQAAVGAVATQGLRRAPVAPAEDDDRWTQARAAQAYAENQAQSRRNFSADSPFLSSLEAGWEGLKGGAHGIAGAAGAAVGADDFARKQLAARDANQQAQQDLTSAGTQNLSDVHGVGDAFDWAERQLGQAIPGIAAVVAPALVTGGTSALVGAGLRGVALRGAARGIGERAIASEAERLGIGQAADAAAQAAIRQQAARNVAQRAGTTLAEDAAPESLGRMAADTVSEKALPRLRALARTRAPELSPLQAELRRAPGAVLGGAVMSGEGATQALTPDMTDDQLRDASGKALAGAAGEGALMAIPGLALMSRYGAGEAAKVALARKLGAPLLKRMAREGAEQAVIGGAIAPATAAANRVVHNWITGQGLTDGLVSDDALSEYLNSAAGGAVAGFALGAPAGARFGDIKLPALSKRTKLWRRSQKIDKAQQDAAKPAPGEEINLDGTPKGSDEASTIFHSTLEQVQRARSDWEQNMFEGLKPFDLDEDHAGAITIGTTNNVPGAKLFDPAQMADARQVYPGKDNALNAGVASLLSPESLLADSTDTAVRATAKAVQHGFDSLSKSEQTSVGRYLNLLPPEKQSGFKRLLLTVGALSDDQRARLTLAPAKDAESKAAPDAATIGANDEGRAAVGTEGGEGSGGLEGKLTERDALPTEELGSVPDAVWKAAQFHGDISKSTLPRDEQVAIEVPKKNGKGTRTAALSLRAAASGLTKTESGRALLEGETNRKVGAVLGVIGEAAVRGERINPRSIHEGMRVFPDDEDGSGVLTAADAAEIRRRVANQGTPKARAANAAQRSERQAAAVENPQSVVGLGARARADEQRATRGESKQALIEPERPERTAGEGDFGAPDEAEHLFAPREYPGVGTGETLTAKGDAGASRSASLVKRITAGDARHEGAIASLKKQYDSAKMMAEGAKARGDQSAHSRAVARMKDAADQAKALRTKHAERRAKLVQQFKDVNADVRFKERGAGENPVAGRKSNEYQSTLDDVDRLASKLKVDRGRVTTSTRGKAPERDDAGRLTAIYKAAKEKPNSQDKVGLLTSIRRLADGNAVLTDALDKVDGVKGMPRANDTQAQRDLLAQADALDVRAKKARGKRAAELRTQSEALRAQARAGANVDEGRTQSAIEKAVEMPKKGGDGGIHSSVAKQRHDSRTTIEHSKFEESDAPRALNDIRADYREAKKAGDKARMAALAREAESAKVQLPRTSPFTAKDQAKADKANKFIGRGSTRSSTNAYAKAWGARANSGKYSAGDRVFVSAEGARSGRIAPDFAEIKRATDAGAKIITDFAPDRERSYNVGEREVAAFLKQQGYGEKRPGEWERTTIEHSKIEEPDTLARPNKETRSVKQRIAALKQTKLYKAIQAKIDEAFVTKPNVRQTESQAQAIVNSLAKAFKVSAPRVELFKKGSSTLVNGEFHTLGLGALERTGSHTTLHLADNLEPHELVSVLTHEFGHHLQHELFDKLPADSPVRKAIEADFEAWSAKLKDTDTGRTVRASRAPFFGTLADIRLNREGKASGELSAEAREYRNGFSEYFADNTARALQDHEFVQTTVGRFFAKVAEAMKMLYDFARGNPKYADLIAPKQSFKDFVQSAYDGSLMKPPEAAAADRYAAANDLAAAARQSPAEAARMAAEAPNDVGSTPPGGTPPPGRPPGGTPGGAGGMPSDVTAGLNSRDRGLIERLVTRRDVFEKILKEFPQLREPLMTYATQMETATNAAYALWAAGKLKLSGDEAGTGYAGAFRRFNERVQNVFGLKSTQQLGTRIFNELKSGTYDMKDDVRTRQRRDYLAVLAARAKTAEGAEAAAIKGRVALRRSINYALHVRNDVIAPLVDRALRGLDERLRATNNPALRKFVASINRMTGEAGAAESFVNEIHRVTNQRANQLVKMVDGLSKEDEALVLKHLMLGGYIPKRPDLTALRNRLYDFTSQFEKTTDEGGSFGHITGGFFPYRFDHAAARANAGEVHSIMSEIGGAGDKDGKLEQGARDYFAAHWAKQNSDRFLQTPEARSSLKGRREATTALHEAAKKYADDLSVDALRERMADILLRDPTVMFRASLQDDPFMGSRKPSGGPSLNPRAFGLFDKAGRHDLLERLQKFQAPSVVDTMLPYLHSMVKRQAFYKEFVRKRATPESQHLPKSQQVEEQYNVLDEHLAEAKKTGATDKDIQLARDYMDAQLGLYGDPNGHPLIQKLFQAVDKQLGTKLGAEDSRTWEKLSNAITTYQNVRVLGLGILGNMIDPLGNWTRASNLRTAFTGYRRAMQAAFSKADSSYLRAHAEALGVAERHALSEGLSWAFNAQGTPGTLSYRINQALFKYNGMQMMTNFARIAALASAHKFLLEHAQLKGPHSERYLRELGLQASDIKPDAQHPGYVDASGEKVQKALFQFVDEAVVRPHAGHRPLWHADPGFKMLSQYRGFIFSFYDTIVKRMMHEAKHGNVGGVAPLVGYLGVTMAAELAREMVQYGPAGNPHRKDWDASDWVAYSLERSGALGPRADFMNSAYPEIANSHVPIPYESLTGPTVSQMDSWVRMAVGQRSTSNTALQSLPGESIYHGWVQRGNASDTHQSAGQIVANFADDFVLE